MSCPPPARPAPLHQAPPQVDGAWETAWQENTRLAWGKAGLGAHGECAEPGSPLGQTAGSTEHQSQKKKATLRSGQELREVPSPAPYGWLRHPVSGHDPQEVTM